MGSCLCEFMLRFGVDRDGPDKAEEFAAQCRHDLILVLAAESARHKIGLVIVDCLQLIEGERGREKNRAQSLGEVSRASLKRQHALKLKVKKFEAVAYTSEQKADMLAAAKRRRSRAIYPALMLALHAGMRDAETRTLQWGPVDLQKKMIRIGDAKSDAGQGRTIPLNADVHAALVAHSKWYMEKFGEIRPEW